MDTDANWSYVGVVWRWQNVWVILAVTLITVPTADSQEYKAKGCPGGQEDSPPVEVTLTCPKGQVISLGEAKFGRNKYALCSITDGDCLDKTDAFVGCEGRHKCTVHFDKPFSPTCGYATFITVTYDCRTVTSTATPTVTSTRVISNTAKIRIITTTAAITDTGDTQEDNTALIAGCVVAVTVTVILLIIAIIMVVRRLACGSDLSVDEEKKSTSCHILPCLQENHNDTGHKPRLDETDSHNSGEGDDARRSKRKRKHRSRWADKNQNMSPRLAPVGQEDEDSSASQKPTVVVPPAAARVSVYSEGASSARSSLAVDNGAQLKRHSSGVRASDISRHEAGELDDFSRQGGEGGEGKGIRRGVRSSSSSTGSGKMTSTGFLVPTQDRGPPSRMHNKPSLDKQAARTAKLQNQYDAVAVPNTETFTSC
ncbi:hypothetical protein ACOMHN_035593 [Nucella lapillus]